MKLSQAPEINNNNNYCIYFNSEINNSTVNSLIKRIEPLKDKLNPKITLYFSTEGGFEPDGAVLIDYLNNLTMPLEMVICESISSLGFLVYILTNCPKKYIYNTMSIIHISDVDISYRESHKSKSWDFLMQKDLNITTKRFMTFLKELNFLTKKELELVFQGHDITVSLTKLKKAYKNFQKLSNKSDYPKKLFIWNCD